MSIDDMYGLLKEALNEHYNEMALLPGIIHDRFFSIDKEIVLYNKNFAFKGQIAAKQKKTCLNIHPYFQRPYPEQHLDPVTITIECNYTDNCVFVQGNGESMVSGPDAIQVDFPLSHPVVLENPGHFFKEWLRIYPLHERERRFREEILIPAHTALLYRKPLTFITAMKQFGRKSDHPWMDIPQDLVFRLGLQPTDEELASAGQISEENMRYSTA